MVDYKSTGVDAQKKEGSLGRLLEYVNQTFQFSACKPLLPIGYFANVIDLTPVGFPVGIAFSTDGVGTKILVAEMAKKYDTVGIDCVAMNVNDLLCVGATPISMVDYIAISEANPQLLEEIAKGLFHGCEMARVNLSGGELAQVAELLAKRAGSISLDIVGTAIGTVAPDRIIVGQNLQHGDVLIGLESSGLHSNGYTLARKVCFEIGGFKVNQFIEDLGRTIGEELLEPTRIYVPEILEIIQKIPVKGLFHITGDGLFNLTRTVKPIGYRIESFPEPPPVFKMIKKLGNIADEEMFRVFNMGIGFAIVIPSDSSYIRQALQIIHARGYKAHVLGHVIDDPERHIHLESYSISGRNGKFSRL